MSRAEVRVAHFLAPPVRILLVADMQNPTTRAGSTQSGRLGWWSSALRGNPTLHPADQRPPAAVPTAKRPSKRRHPIHPGRPLVV